MADAATKRFLLKTMALAEAIQALKEVSSGHLYATVMGSMDIHTYNEAISVLRHAKLVEQDGSHLLRWIGPATFGQQKGART